MTKKYFREISGDKTWPYLCECASDVFSPAIDKNEPGKGRKKSTDIDSCRPTCVRREDSDEKCWQCLRQLRHRNSLLATCKKLQKSPTWTIVASKFAPENPYNTKYHKKISTAHNRLISSSAFPISK